MTFPEPAQSLPSVTNERLIAEAPCVSVRTRRYWPLVGNRLKRNSRAVSWGELDQKPLLAGGVVPTVAWVKSRAGCPGLTCIVAA